MKVLLYFESEKVLSISGIGRARRHQIMACESAGIDYTLNPLDDYDILHINTTLLNSKAMVENARRHQHGDDQFKPGFRQDQHRGQDQILAVRPQIDAKAPVFMHGAPPVPAGPSAG